LISLHNLLIDTYTYQYHCSRAFVWYMVAQNEQKWHHPRPVMIGCYYASITYCRLFRCNLCNSIWCSSSFL